MKLLPVIQNPDASKVVIVCGDTSDPPGKYNALIAECEAKGWAFLTCYEAGMAQFGTSWESMPFGELDPLATMVRERQRINPTAKIVVVAASRNGMNPLLLVPNTGLQPALICTVSTAGNLAELYAESDGNMQGAIAQRCGQLEGTSPITPPHFVYTMNSPAVQIAHFDGCRPDTKYFIIHAENDPTIPYHHATDLAAAMAAQGWHHELWNETSGHGLNPAVMAKIISEINVL